MRCSGGERILEGAILPQKDGPVLGETLYVEIQASVQLTIQTKNSQLGTPAKSLRILHDIFRRKKSLEQAFGSKAHSLFQQAGIVLPLEIRNRIY